MPRHAGEYRCRPSNSGFTSNVEEGRPPPPDPRVGRRRAEWQGPLVRGSDGNCASGKL
jgi:hypothetical protein